MYKTFGGRLKFFGIGGSKLDPVVEEFLLKAKFPYAIGYGLTETAPLITAAPVGKTAVGSIGHPAYNVEVRLQNVDPKTGEGEIIAKGDNVMLGYYKDPERTREAITDDGWFRTHDLASVDSKGRYYIKGRLGNMILGPSGENIYPEEIEQVINQVRGVSDSLVMERDGKLVALVRFDEKVIDWNQEREDNFFENLQAKKKAVLDFVNKHVNKQSKIGEVEADPFGQWLFHSVIRETCAVATAKGVPMDADEFIAHDHKDIVTNIADYYPSMCQDMLFNHRQTEIDVLNGKIAEYGEQLGIDTPVCKVLSQVVRCIQGNYDKQFFLK